MFEVRSGRLTWLLPAIVLLIAGCTAPPRQMPAGVSTTAAASRQEARDWRIVPEQSEIRVLVYRAGPLAAFGHNHVIVWKPVGWVSPGATLSGSSFGIEVPLQAAQVDDTGDRAQEGGEFAGEIPADARAGTLRNMQGPDLLDAASHPRLSIRSVAIDASGAVPVAQVIFSLAGHEVMRKVPFALQQQAQLRAWGELRIRQSELGLKPFSIMLGALQVRDELDVRFRFVADRSGPTP